MPDISLAEHIDTILDRLPASSEHASQLTRGMFDVNLRWLVDAMVLRDAALPILMSNSLRALSERLPAGERARAIVGELSRIVDSCIDNPRAFSERAVASTRITRRDPAVRADADGILFHTDGTERAPGIRDDIGLGSLGYGFVFCEYELLGARGLSPDEPVPPQPDLAVYLVTIANPRRLGLEGDGGPELVVPGCVMNRDIEHVIIGLNVHGSEVHRLDAQYIHLCEDPSGELAVHLSAAGSSFTTKYDRRLLVRGERIGSIGLSSGGTVPYIDVAEQSIQSALEAVLRRAQAGSYFGAR